MEDLLFEKKDELLPIYEIKSNILSHYNLENSSVSNIKFKDTEKQRAVYKIDFNNKSYCLKKVYYEEEELLYVYSAMEWCYKNDITVPKLLKTKNNNRFVRYNNMLFILTPWLKGEKCEFDSLNHVLLSAKTLGKLHIASKNFSPIEGSLLKKGLEDYSETISKHFNDLLKNIEDATKHNDRFSKIFLNNIDENIELAKISFDISSSINKSKLSSSLCHGDYVNKNILIDGNEISIIDFDKCKTDYCSKDLSYFLRRLLKRENTRWNVDLTFKILDEYMKYNKLSSDDLKYILAYIAFPQKFWKLSKDYYKNIRKCNKNLFISLFNKNLNKSKGQRKFIYELIEAFYKKYNITI